MTLIYILIATIAVSLVSLIGALIIALSKKNINKLLLGLVALSGGGLMGGAFLHLIPEAIEEIGHEAEQLQTIFLFVIVGFLLFLLIEQYLHWHHHHHPTEEHCQASEDCAPKKPMSALIIFGDAIHNLIDGLIIAASFIVNPAVGVVTTLAVALHEIPQEIGDFGVLIYGGYTKKKALLFNFLSGLMAVFGGIMGFVFSEMAATATLYLLPIAAGGFIYIAASDLVPEIKHGEHGTRMARNFIIFICGIGIMLLLKFLPFGE